MNKNFVKILITNIRGKFDFVSHTFLMILTWL